MSKPKIEIGVKRETNDPSNKLTFSRQAQQAARTRMEEEKRLKKHVPIKIVPLRESTSEIAIDQKRVDDTMELARREKDSFRSIEQDKLLLDSERNLVGKLSEATDDRSHQEGDDEPQQSRLPKEEQFPFFPGIYPTLYRQEQDMHFEQGLHRAHADKVMDRKEQEEEEYLDLGPIYEEQESKHEKKSIQLKERFHPVTYSKTEDTFESSRTSSRFIGGLKLLLSVLGAIGLGVIFGYLLLLFYLMGTKSTIETLDPSSANQMVEERAITTNPVDLQLTKGGKVVVGKLTVADRTFYAIQAGVFAEQRSASEATAALQQKNVPILLFNDDVYRLFIGIGYLEQDAVQLSQFYKLLGSELYLKKYTVQGGVVSIPGASTEQMEILNKYFTHGTYLLERTAAWTGATIDRSLTISAEDWQKYKSTHQTFLTESEQLQAVLPEEQKHFIEQMSESMDKAVLSMVAYIEGNDREQFITSQQGLLDYFESYRALLKSTGVDVVMR